MATVFEQIEACSNPNLLRRWIKNARAKSNDEVERAARLRLYEVLPREKPDTFEHDVWKSIYALEELESAKRGKTVRLQRTRNLIHQVGEHACVESLLMKGTASKGFDMLLGYELPHFLFEAIALRHPEGFSAQALTNAEQRMAIALEQDERDA